MNAIGEGDYSNEVGAVGSGCASCLAILTAVPDATDGAYTIDPDGAGGSDPFDVYCDMTNDGGGWTLILKGTTDATFNYTANYWTTSNTLNETDLTLTAASAKYESFNTLSFESIRGCVTTPTTNCVSHTFSSTKSSALALFSGSYLNEGVTKSEFNTVFGYTTCDCCGPGFNTDYNSESSARWGFHWDCNQACSEDQDAAMGFGIRGQDWSDGASAGYGGGGDTAPPCVRKDSWLWVK